MTGKHPLSPQRARPVLPHVEEEGHHHCGTNGGIKGWSHSQNKGSKADSLWVVFKANLVNDGKIGVLAKKPEAERRTN